MNEHNESSETAETTKTTGVVIYLGDVADLTLGTGRSTAEAKRHIYN